MGSFNRRAAIVAFVALASVSTAAAQEVRTVSIEAGKLFKYLNLYYRIPPAERTLFTLSYFVNAAGAPLSQVKVSTSAGAAPLAADGKVMRLPTAEMLRRKDKVTIQGPKGAKFDLSMQLESLAPPAAEMPAAPLVGSVTQANKGIKGAAGLIGGMVPTMGRLVFKNAGTGQVVLADGRRAALPAAQGTPVFDPAAWPNARSLTFQRAPSRIFIAPVPKPKKR